MCHLLGKLSPGTRVVLPEIDIGDIARGRGTVVLSGTQTGVDLTVTYLPDRNLVVVHPIGGWVVVE